ncbi:RHOMBOID-like protein 8 [Impatiens glandulifera]|uniref:RHOMBOID-like protein 8 n=1 Tax=Impatiens glandulifera TaxID=253017 RepID=UPI001FB1295B|nr:RHOMBOID-like protein 8 [Impatiens glandulifera]
MSGSLVAALFLNDKPSVASSAALFGLIGTMLSALVQNWTTYSNKLTAIAVLVSVSIINIVLGLLPYVNNVGNMGGFISGFLLGFVVLFKPQLGKMGQGKGAFFEYEVKCSAKLRQKLDRPVLRSTVLFIFVALMVGSAVAVSCGVNIREYCWWCKYLDCVPSKWWSCNGDQMKCEMGVSTWQLTLTCMSSSDRYMDFPFTNISQARVQDLCDMICSSPLLV